LPSQLQINIEQQLESSRLNEIGMKGVRSGLLNCFAGLVTFGVLAESALTTLTNVLFLIAFFAGVVIRMVVAVHYTKSIRDFPATQKFKQQFFIATLGLGLVWGAWLLIAHPLSFKGQVTVFSVVGCMTFMALSTLSAYRNSYYALSAPPVLAICIGPYLHSSETFSPLVFLAFGVYSFALYLLKMQSELLDSSIRERLRARAVEHQQLSMFESDRAAALKTTHKELAKINAKASELLGVGEYAVMLDLCRGLNVKTRHWERLLYLVEKKLVQRGMLVTTVRFKRPDGDLIWIDLQACLVDPINPDAGVLWSISDSTSRRELELRNQFLATHDVLTGVSNRSSFEVHLRDLSTQAVGERTTQGFAVLSLDLDGFKAVNDAHGHAVGDAVLKIVAQRIKRCLRTHDMVARVGGDEFLVLLEQTPLREQAVVVGEKIIETICKPIMIDERTITVGVSVGTALWPSDSIKPEALLRIADTGMYTTKQAGRNAYRRALTGFV
jgi:diguanylate cyclase (GGDEF)-like protein